MEGMLFKGEKVIVPLSLRGDMIQHTHMGVEKSKHTLCQPQRIPAVTLYTRETMASGRYRPLHLEHSKFHCHC